MFERWKNRKFSLVSAAILSALLWLAFIALTWVAPDYRVDVQNAQIKQLKGHSYLYPVRRHDSLLYKLYSDASRGKRSNMRLFEDKTILEPGGQNLANIESLGLGRFAHWGDYLYFSTSDNSNPITNGRQYAFEYQMSLNDNVTIAFIISNILLLFLINRRMNEENIKAVRAVSNIVFALWFFIAALSASFIVLVLYITFTGNPVASATILSYFKSPNLIMYIETILPRILVYTALLGFLLSLFLKIYSAKPTFLDVSEVIERSNFKWYAVLLSFIITFTAVYVFALGAMSMGFDNPTHLGYMSHFGQVPHSDNQGYTASSTLRMAGYEMSAWAARRPIAQSVRDLSFWLSGGGYTHVLLLQCIAIGTAMGIATFRLMLWRGIWSAFAFAGFTYVFSRYYIASTLTEPLSLLVVLVGITFLIEYLRTKHLPYGWIAFGWIALALNIRMGALFVLPALGVWLVFFVSKSFKERLASGIAVISIIAVFAALNYVIAEFYAAPNAAVGGNFSYILCGLSVDGFWSTCSHSLYAQEYRLLANEREMTDFLYRKAFENISQNPIVFLNSLWSNIILYAYNISSLYTRGFNLEPWPWFLLMFTFLLIGIRLLMLFLSRELWHELWMWILTGVAILMSAALIMRDDGWRTLHVTHALVALLLACGFATTVRSSVPRSIVIYNRSTMLAAGFSAGFLVCFALGPYLLGRSGWLPPKLSLGHPENRVVMGGSRLLGILVVPDGSELLKHPRSVSWSQFKLSLSRPLGHRNDFAPAFERLEAKLPFGYINAVIYPGAPRIIVPAEVFLRPSVSLWEINVDPNDKFRSSDLFLEFSRSVKPYEDAQ